MCIPYEIEAERCLDDVAPGMRARLEGQFPGITMRPVFEPETAQRMEDESARMLDPPRDSLLSVFRVERPSSIDPKRLAEALRREKIVKYASDDHPPVPARP